MSRASDLAYRKIRAQILSGELAPGSQLKEEDLADICKVSRTPIRDALRRLEAEMFIRRTDTQRSYVAEWSSADIDEIFTLRAMLESYAAGQAALRMSAAQQAELQAHNATIHDAISGRKTLDIDTFLHHNRLFHNLIIEAAGSERLTSLITRIVQQPVVHRTALRYDRSELVSSYTEHQQLVMAIAERDADWAQAVMQAHIRRAFHAYKERSQMQVAKNRS